jgi:predicted transcriptional regulator
MMNTVEENKHFFTNRQIAAVYKARELYHALETTSVHDFKTIIIMNVIKNNPVSLEDLKISERIFGSYIGRIKSKTTRIKPNPVISDYMEIPQESIEEQRDIALCIETMFINGIAFFIITSRNILIRTAEPITNQ